jgi:hypothetical protein
MLSDVFSGRFTDVCSLNVNVSEHCVFHLHGTECSETLAFKIQTPANLPEESIHIDSIFFRNVCVHRFHPFLLHQNAPQELEIPL